MNKIILTFFFAIVVYGGFSQRSKFYYENFVSKEDIKSVQFYREGFVLSNPVMELGEDIKLLLKFDDLSGKPKNYYYTLIHCDASWNESFILQNEYLDGIPDNPVDDYAMSFNTTFSFVNYQIAIPNEKIRLKLSGNYVMVVYEDNNKQKPVLARRFMVYEHLSTIEGTVRRATLDEFKGENHEIDFTVYYKNIRIDNPLHDIKVMIQQNNRWDNAITNLKPSFIRDNALVYDYDKENVFPAGNEFRYFDIRTIRVPGEGVLGIDFHRPYYHITLMTDEARANKKFFSYKEMNGNYVVESQEKVENYDLQCDYAFVHFSLKLPSILIGGTVNVFGALTGWNANKSNEMTWNFNESRYELSMLLKQGYYNFQYAYVEHGSPKADLTNIEGSFWETNDDYQILVYFSDISKRYDRLIGYQQLSLR
jgi:hypothetical protein